MGGMGWGEIEGLSKVAGGTVRIYCTYGRTIRSERREKIVRIFFSLSESLHLYVKGEIKSTVLENRKVQSKAYNRKK